MAMTLLYVTLAGGAGSAARYLVGINFPHGTIIVNVLGSFLMGTVVQLGLAGNWSAELRAALAVGFLGGFTTYSSFNQQTLVMLERGDISAALTNITITLFGCLAAGWLGLSVVRLFYGH
jgi:CrcB protein